MEALLISGLIFLAVIGLIVGIHQVRSQEQTALQKRLDNLLKSTAEDPENKGQLKAKANTTQFLYLLGKNLNRFNFTNKMTVELRKADLLLRLEEFLGLNVLTAAGGFLLGLLISSDNNILVMLFTLIGTLFPSFVVWRKKKAREAELNEQIGESLTGMANSLRAGYSFQQAMDLVSKETTGPLASEYRRTIREINLGVTTDEALQNLVARASNEDLELIISAVLIQRQIGGNLAEIFDKIVDTIRQRIRLKGEIKTLTAQGRITGYVIGLLPVLLFVALLIISPDYIGVLLKNPIGWILLGGAVVSEIIGFMFIRKITNIEI